MTMMKSFLLSASLMLVALLSLPSTIHGLKVGDAVCVEGFIMDRFCIDRGTLFDNSNIRTLEGPEEHSVHCLIDVPSCVNSPFEILLDPNDSSNGLYRRGFEVDGAGQAMLIALAKKIGICTDCDGTGSLRKGMRAAVRGTIASIPTSGNSPPVINVEAVLDDTAEALCSSAPADTTETAISDPAAAGSGGIEIGSNVCVEGFIMDHFCIQRGTLLDAPSITTLEEPDRHSVHCLIDVPSCVQSPFEILLDPNDASDGLYRRGWRVDSGGQDMLIALAKKIGECTDCDGTGDLSHGMRAAVKGSVTTLASGSVPPIIKVEAVLDGTAQELCASDPDGSNSGNFVVVDDVDFVIAADDTFERMAYAHGSLMLIGWGWLLPMGATFAAFFKHRPNGLWYQIHRALQVLGLIIACIGWYIALSQFTSLNDKGLPNYRHAVMGCTTMALGLLQPLNAIIRPHPPLDGEPKQTTRLLWEILHKGVGYTSILLAFATIGLGTTLLPTPDVQRTFQIAFGLGTGSTVVLLAIALLADKYSYKPAEEPVVGGKETPAEPVPEKPVDVTEA